MNWVIDCSFAAALFLPDEQSERVSDFFSRLPQADEVFVPSIWWYELTNVLAVSVTRNRLTPSAAARIFALFEDLRLTSENRAGPEYAKGLFDVTQTYKLSAYDAAYLELAIRKQSSLASLDDQLCKAATKAGLRIYKI